MFKTLLKAKESQPLIELNDTAYSEILILGSPFKYKLSERGKQLLKETGLLDEIIRMLKLYINPSCRLRSTEGYVLHLGVEKICKSAVEKAVPVEAFMGTVITGFQDFYVKLYGLPQ